MRMRGHAAQRLARTALLATGAVWVVIGLVFLTAGLIKVPSGDGGQPATVVTSRWLDSGGALIRARLANGQVVSFRTASTMEPGESVSVARDDGVWDLATSPWVLVGVGAVAGAGGLVMMGIGRSMRARP